MARATISKVKAGSGRQPAKLGRPKSKTAEVQPAVKSAVSRGRPAAKPAASAGAVSKDDLRARIEKLERANSTLRAKNKELRLAHVEASEQLDQLTLRLEAMERRAERQARAETETPAGRGRGSAASPRRRAALRAAVETSSEEDSEATARTTESMAV